MAVRIRLKRMGRKAQPFFRIVVAEAQSKRDGKEIEILGYYDPLAAKEKQLAIERERIQHWLGVGAQPSTTVANLLKKAEVKKA